VSNLNPRNLAAIRAGNYTPQQLAECIKDIVDAHNNISQQKNAAPVGTIPAPEPHSKISVLGGGGILDVALTDNSPQYQGKEHFFDYSTDGFQTFRTKSLGPAKNWRGSLGSGQFSIRSYTQYDSSPPSAYKFADSTVDTSSGTEPAMQPGQGSGTDNKGYGTVPYNASKPPTR
jgi:hypothetical protein